MDVARRSQLAGEAGDPNRPILLVSVQKNFNTVGLKGLHYLLLERGHRSHLLFLKYLRRDSGEQLERLRPFVQRLAPAWIGVSLMTDEFEDAAHVSAFFREECPDAPIIWGGWHATAAPEDCFPHADYVCVGEGEAAILAIAQRVERGEAIAEVGNLCRAEGQTTGPIRVMTRNPLLPRVEDLDTIPYHDHVPRDAFLMLPEGPVVPMDRAVFRRHARYWGRTYDIMTSRGCPFACTYCCNSVVGRLYGKGPIRRRSPRHIIAELENALGQYPELALVHVHDDSFVSGSMSYLRELCDLYRRRIGLPFYAHAVPNAVSHKKVALLKSAGMRWLSIGLQSGSEEVCKEVYQRGAGPADFLRAAAIIDEHEIAPVYDVIVDNPLETDAQRLETIDVLMRTPKPYYLQIYALQPYFGTQIHDVLSERCPERVVDPRRKDYLSYQKTPLNSMTRLAVYLGPGHMEALLALHRRDPDGLLFRVALAGSQWASALLFEPRTYFQVLNRAAAGSYRETLRLLLFYSSNITRYLRQFGPWLSKMIPKN